MIEEQKRLARLLYEFGVIRNLRDSPGGLGFSRKANRRDPSLSLAPFYFDFRTEDHPVRPGPITRGAVGIIARALLRFAYDLRFEFRVVAGIPHTGEKIAERFVYASNYDPHVHLIRLGKEDVGGGQTRIVGVSGDYLSGDMALLLDDVISEGGSKDEAIVALKSAGVTVRDAVVVIDRQQGGMEMLEALGVKGHALFTAHEFFEFGHTLGLLSSEDYRRNMQYLVTGRW